MNCQINTNAKSLSQSRKLNEMLEWKNLKCDHRNGANKF